MLDHTIRKKHYSIILLITALYVFMQILSTSVLATEAEVRGLWVVRDTLSDSESIIKLVDFAEKHNFNVLFVQVRGRGDAWYNSYFVPGPASVTLVGNGFDPLSELIGLAHDRGIEVHAWLNMYLTWSDDNLPESPEHPLNKHPEWFMVSAGGVSMADCPIETVRNDILEGRYISPALEEVRSYLSRVITEVVVTYNVDGIHLDYVRYPGRDYDFHPRVLADFEAIFEVDARDVVVGSVASDPTLQYLGKWVEFRAEKIDRQVKSIRRRIELVDPGIRLSAAVKAHAGEALYRFGQDWAGWLNEGLLDFVVTMSYYPDNKMYRDIMEDNLELVDARKVVGGIGAYKMDAKNAVSQAELIRELGLLGHCVFSYTTLVENPRYSRSFSKAAQKGDITPPNDFKPYLRNTHE